MNKPTLGKMIASLRKENEMTQLDLAEKMGITDKAVSKIGKRPFLPGCQFDSKTGRGAGRQC